MSFRLRSNAKRISMVRITLTPDDLYTMEFIRFSKRAPDGMVLVSTHEGVYCDMLQNVFTSETELYTSFR